MFFVVFFVLCLFRPIFALNLKLIAMPVRRVPGGYQFGTSGKVYPTKEQAERQAKAIYASGYREKKK